MVSEKLQVSETFHSISKSQNGICDKSWSRIFVIFLKFRIFELFALKVLNFLARSQRRLGFTIHHPLYWNIENIEAPTLWGYSNNNSDKEVRRPLLGLKSVISGLIRSSCHYNNWLLPVGVPVGSVTYYLGCSNLCMGMISHLTL